LGDAGDHVRDEGLVARRVEDGEVLLVGLEEGSAHLHRFALVALLLVRVQRPREIPERVRMQMREA
jgi:hypothetical protein